jgi:hypothetical protein
MTILNGGAEDAGEQARLVREAFERGEMLLESPQQRCHEQPATQSATSGSP